MRNSKTRYKTRKTNKHERHFKVLENVVSGDATATSPGVLFISTNICCAAIRHSCLPFYPSGYLIFFRCSINSSTNESSCFSRDSLMQPFKWSLSVSDQIPLNAPDTEAISRKISMHALSSSIIFSIARVCPSILRRRAISFVLVSAERQCERLDFFIIGYRGIAYHDMTQDFSSQRGSLIVLLRLVFLARLVPLLVRL